jgi:hypothetical protein
MLIGSTEFKTQLSTKVDDYQKVDIYINIWKF